jgi:hypothetical protein
MIQGNSLYLTAFVLLLCFQIVLFSHLLTKNEKIKISTKCSIILPVLRGCKIWSFISVVHQGY